MGMPFKAHLSGQRIFACSKCGVHLAYYEDIVSKSFQGRHGRAYLFDSVVNVSVGEKENRTLITGLHSVADIQCNVCHSTLGWKYLEAFEESQKYKENKFIIERVKMMKEDGWV
ncbi:hypothetical protein NDN08_005967 [Rhodosorus marinus]|uniref:Protein yippee-like n=1 Tax=Rhodosorus marinus TaxID=101924 RepID=A0AAV8UNC5_9RHOD|nr:hypothetical protein NDN08_005967 [Rhodosorus marinus]|mmetsp:Transcript_2847/g.13312  ORF Transcript_2847/g.13312 Transcript_2847/m.13312 type:complete len:114 (+) Transcript_2847:692-1033(+)